MHKRIIYFICIFVILSTLSCRKDPQATCTDNIQNQNEIGVDCGGVCSPCPYIIYPQDGSYGPNLLFLSDSAFTGGNFTGFNADLYYGASVKIHWTTISGISGPALIIHYGWTQTNLDYSFENWFHTTEDTTQVAEFYIPSPGSALLEYYENGIDTLGPSTFSKTITY